MWFVLTSTKKKLVDVSSFKYIKCAVKAFSTFAVNSADTNGTLQFFFIYQKVDIDVNVVFVT